MPDFIPGKGSKLQLSISSVLTDIPSMTVLKSPQSENPVIEVTDMQDTDRKYISQKVRSHGVVGGTIEWDPSNTVHAALLTAFRAGTESTFKILYANAAASEFAFTGFITKLGIDDLQNNNIATIPFEIQINGDATLTV